MNGNPERNGWNWIERLALLAVLAAGAGAARAGEAPAALLAFADTSVREALDLGREAAAKVRRIPREKFGRERLSYVLFQERTIRESAEAIICAIRLTPELQSPRLEDFNVKAPEWAGIAGAEPHAAR